MRVRALIVGVAAMVVGGCSSPMTIDAYADAATTATDAYVAESQTLSYDYQSGLEDGVRAIAADGQPDPTTRAVDLVTRETIAYLALLSDAIARYLSSLEALVPPKVVSDAHDEYLAAVRFVLDAIPETRDSIEEATDFDAVQLALTGSGFADGQIRWTISCSSLEQAVRDEGVGIDLGCVPPKATP